MTSPFEVAKSQGYSDKEILDHLNSDERFSYKIQSAREAGYSDEEISNYLNSPTAAPEKKERSAYESYIERPKDILASGAAAGIRSLPRTAFDLLKAGTKKLGGDLSRLEKFQEDQPEWVKSAASTVFPTYEEMRQRQIKSGGAEAENAFEKGLEKAGRFTGEAVLLPGGIGGIRGASVIVGSAVGAQVGEELELNPWAQAALTLGGGLAGAKVSSGKASVSKQKITPEVESYIDASKQLGIDPLLTGMNPNQLQKVAQKWATHGIGGPEILREAYESRSGQVSKAFEKAMDEAGAELFTEKHVAGEALKEGIQDATKQIEHTKSQLYRAIDATLPPDAYITIKNPQKLQADLGKTITSLEDSLSLAPKESPVYSRMQRLQRNLEELIDYSDGNIPINKLEATNRSMNEVIRYDRSGGSDKLLIPFAREVRDELERYGKTNPRYATASKAAKEYFTDSVVHIRQNLLQSIARSERPESTLAIMNNVSGIKNVEKALSSLPDGKRLFDGLKRYKLQSVIKDKIFDPSTGLMKVDGLKKFLDKKSELYPVLKELAGPQSIKTLKLLQEAGKGLEKGFNNLVNPSRTADTLIALQSILSPAKKIGSGIGKLAKLNLAEGTFDLLSGGAQILAPKAMSRMVLDPKFAEKIYSLSKAAQSSDWRVFNRLLDSIDSELKKDDSKYQEFLAS